MTVAVPKAQRVAIGELSRLRLLANGCGVHRGDRLVTRDVGVRQVAELLEEDHR